MRSRWFFDLLALSHRGSHIYVYLQERKSYDVRLLFISNFAIGFLLFNAITRIPQFKQIAKCKHLFTSIQAPFIAKKSICCVIRKSQ